MDDDGIKGDEFSDSEFVEFEKISKVDLARWICDLQHEIEQKDHFIEGFCFEVKEQRKAIKTLLAALNKHQGKR